MGVAQTTVGRWRTPGDITVPAPGSIAAFCRGYGRNPIEGFVAAGLLDEGEVGERALPQPSLQLLRALKTIAAATPQPDTTEEAAYVAARRELLGRETSTTKRRRRAAGAEEVTG